MKKMIIAALMLALSGAAGAARVKDIAQFEGVRSNSLIGYGLIVGLDGTGDQTTQTPFTTQAMQAMLSQMGVNLPPGTQLQTKNTAAVMVTAELPAFARPGATIDITVSSMGNSKSLRGGTLLMTPLKAPDGRVYALAQGNVIIAGPATGKAAPAHLNAGRIPEGARVERPAPVSAESEVALVLNTPDWSTAQQVEQAINKSLGNVAKAANSRRIVLKASRPDDMVDLAAKIEGIEINAPTAAAKVVVNARTGSLVMGQGVRVTECAIAHGNISIAVAAPAEGQQQGGVEVKQGEAVAHVKPQATLSEVIKALNGLGVGPSDLLAILQAMKAAGALQAELEVI